MLAAVQLTVMAVASACKMISALDCRRVGHNTICAGERKPKETRAKQHTLRVDLDRVKDTKSKLASLRVLANVERVP